MLAELLIETAVLALPIREIVKLNLSVRKKVLVVTMFCMGGFVLIVSLHLSRYLKQTADETLHRPASSGYTTHGRRGKPRFA